MLKNRDFISLSMSALSKSGHFVPASVRCRGGFVFLGSLFPVPVWGSCGDGDRGRYGSQLREAFQVLDGGGEQELVSRPFQAAQSEPREPKLLLLQLHALAYNLSNLLRTLALPQAMAHWPLTTLREKLVKIGARMVRNGRYITFQMAEVAVSGQMFGRILARIARLRAPPVPV